MKPIANKNKVNRNDLKYNRSETLKSQLDKITKEHIDKSLDKEFENADTISNSLFKQYEFVNDGTFGSIIKNNRNS